MKKFIYHFGHVMILVLACARLVDAKQLREFFGPNKPKVGPRCIMIHGLGDESATTVV